ncbi:MAG: hypothetical protein ACJ79S_01835 [Gemmatimonadaceae bacterium]
MSAPQLVIRPGGEADGKTRKPTSNPDAGWLLLSRVGLAFLAVGVFDVALGWVPPHFGSPEWEFGTIARTLDSLPITLLGLALTLAGAAARGIAWATRAASLAALLLAALLVAALAVYALDVPLAFRVVTDPLARSGLERAVAKALVQGTLYPTVLAAIGITGIRLTLRARPRLS